MAGKKPSALAAPFQGLWRIAEIDLWDNDALDLVEPAFLEMKGQESRCSSSPHRLARHPL